MPVGEMCESRGPRRRVSILSDRIMLPSGKLWGKKNMIQVMPEVFQGLENFQRVNVVLEPCRSHLVRPETSSCVRDHR